MQTWITVTPVENTKRAKVAGEAAIGETVGLRIVGAAVEIASGLRARIVDGRVDCAVFPKPDTEDAWTTDGNDAVGTIALDTRELRLVAFKHGGRRATLRLVIDDGGEDTMLCAAPIPLLVWRKDSLPPDPVGPSAELTRRVGALEDALGSETQHRVDGDNALSDRIDAIPDPPVESVNGKTGAVVLSTSDVGAAPSSHTHTKSQITDFPQSMAPTAHASSHKTGGADALKPSDIGAAPAGDYALMSDLPTPYTSLPQMDGEPSPGGSTSAYARGDHVHPTDTSRASVEAATLNGRGVNGSGFSEWTILRDGVDVTSQVQQPVWLDSPDSLIWQVYVLPSEYTDGPTDENPLSVSLSWTAVFADSSETVPYTATREALPGYVLGNQTEKPIPRLSDVPAVVAPSTAASAAGKAADAKATGDALAEKLGTEGGDILGNLNVGGDLNVDLALQVPYIRADNGAGLAVPASGQTTKTLATTDQIPAVSSETWTFEVDDGQGGTTTVQKSVAVFAQAAQGGA